MEAETLFAKRSFVEEDALEVDLAVLVVSEHSETVIICVRHALDVDAVDKIEWIRLFNLCNRFQNLFGQIVLLELDFDSIICILVGTSLKFLHQELPLVNFGVGYETVFVQLCFLVPSVNFWDHDLKLFVMWFFLLEELLDEHTGKFCAHVGISSAVFFARSVL